MKKIAYRPEIDGLRAIAVMSVVIFHVWRHALPKGFLGVDLFFVLSGFLITTIIWREALAGEFSIARFYERRIRRIMPALSIVLLVTTAASAAILLPLDLVGYGKSVLATLAFVANIYFWRDTNYFSRAAEEKPLLHMWSLGVEEQFYIFFPLLLILIARFWRGGAAWVVLALTLMSLLLNIVAIKLGVGYAAFYLLPTRAWEMGAGAFLALTPMASVMLGERMRTAIAAVGLALIIYGVVADVPVTLEVYSALAVVVGTCLVIWTGQSGIGRLLGTRLPVLIGLISYSLYLWHWPIIVLAKYYWVREPTLVEGLVAIAIMIAAAALSWRYVERPFRSRSMRVSTLLGWSGASTAILAGLAAVIIGFGGFPQRLSPAVARINAAVGTNFRCSVADTLAIGTSRGCVLALPSRSPADADVILLGNSHAQMYAPVVEDYLAEKNLRGLLVRAYACLPFTDVNLNADCNGIVESYLRQVAVLPRAKVVVLAFNWAPTQQDYVDGSGKPVAAKGIAAITAGVDATIDRLEAAGKKVVLVGPLAIPGWDVASVTSRSLAFGRDLENAPSRSESEFMAEFGPAIAHFAARKDIVFVPVHEVQCVAGQCDFIRDGASLFSDSNHLAIAALPLFKDRLDQGIDKARAAVN